jgi:hypothetical protein
MPNVFLNQSFEFKSIAVAVLGTPALVYKAIRYAIAANHFFVTFLQFSSTPLLYIPVSSYQHNSAHELYRYRWKSRTLTSITPLGLSPRTILLDIGLPTTELPHYFSSMHIISERKHPMKPANLICFK